MDAKKKEPDWLENVLFLLFIGFGGYAIYNIQYGVWETIKYLIVTLVILWLCLVLSEGNWIGFNKWDCFRDLLLVNPVIILFFIVGSIYNVADNPRYSAEFFVAIFVYLQIMFFAQTWKEAGFIVALLAAIVFNFLLMGFLGGSSMMPFPFIIFR